MKNDPGARFRFSGRQRIKRGRDFLRLREQGKRLVRGCLIANWMELPEGELSRLGVITSRKLGGAVVRNRARRLLREVFRLHQHELKKPVDIILIARRSIAGRKLAGVERDYLSVLRSADLLNPVS